MNLRNKILGILIQSHESLMIEHDLTVEAFIHEPEFMAPLEKAADEIMNEIRVIVEGRAQ